MSNFRSMMMANAQPTKKNMFDKTKIHLNYRLSTWKDVAYGVTNDPPAPEKFDFYGNAGYFVSAPIKVEVGKTYVRNVYDMGFVNRLGLYDADLIRIKYVDNAEKITIEAGCVYVAFNGTVGNLDNITFTLDE